LAPDAARPRKAVIVGASSGVGRALAGELARRGWDLVLSARSLRDLETLAAELETCFSVAAAAVPIDLDRPDLSASDFRQACVERLGAIDAVLLPAGQVHDLDRAPTEPRVLESLLRVNFTGIAQLIGVFSCGFEAQGSGDVVAFSSVSAAAPRSRNAAYAAAKSALEAYCRSVRHHLAGSGVHIQVHALGYVDTAMADGRKLWLPKASPESVAAFAVSRLGSDPGRDYFPRFWGLVAWILRSMPWWLFRRLPF
jgi:uncharacterized protein